MKFKFIFFKILSLFSFAFFQGREQAVNTGKRLNELTKKFKFTKLHHSDMIRAIETANLIRQELKLEDLSVSMDPFLAEGAPIPPEP
jgi:broad specificity phosphatase PhoE